MKTRGYLEGASMANAFNMLRPNDLIWPYVVNVYMKGHSPFPFDLLYWNSDATRMPAANHSFYLRNCYLENRLTRGEMEVGGRMTNMSQPWPYETNYEAIAAQIEADVCEDARLNFRDVRSIRAQLRITGDVNCGMSDSKNFYADFLLRGNLGASEVICSGRYPR